MDRRLLESFVAVAEREHVGQAAAKLHISQSPLSRQIKQLEEELGLELFVREKQRIRLTDSGRWLLERARGLLAHFEELRQEAGQRSRGKMGTLRVGFTSAAMWSGFLPDLVRRFQRKFPQTSVDLKQMRSAAQQDALRGRQLDIGFLPRRGPAGYGIEQECVAQERTKLVLRGRDRLARKRELKACDLDGARWILLGEGEGAGQEELFLGACERSGFRPRVVQRVGEPMTLLALVESGFGIGLLRESARNFAPPSLRFRALHWFTLRARTYMVWRADGRQPLVEAFRAFVREARVGCNGEADREGA